MSNLFRFSIDQFVETRGDGAWQGWASNGAKGVGVAPSKAGKRLRGVTHFADTVATTAGNVADKGGYL